MGYVDDAKNNFFGHFYAYEGVYPAMDSLERYISLYGFPRSLYLDKHSTLVTVNRITIPMVNRNTIVMVITEFPF